MSTPVPVSPQIDPGFPPGSFLFPFLEIFGTKKERPQLTGQRVPRRASNRLTGRAEGLEPKINQYVFFESFILLQKNE